MKRHSAVPSALAVSLLSSLLACGSSGPSSNAKIQFAASGEVLALGGYAYPPASADAVAFADGWEIHFTKFLTTIDKITISTNPDTSASNQSLVGTKVAEIDGPWAMDLHQGGPLPGRGAGEQALPFALLENQNLNGNQPFDPTVRYAFGFDLVPATASAKFPGQMQSSDPDYQDMINNGYVVLYVGTATWRGDAAGAPACTSTDNTFDFTKLPRVVNFRLGFKTPTTYINCQNPDNDPANPLGSEEHERGIQVKVNSTVVAQVTVHTDHPFWESFVHDSPAHFDQLAALATKDASGNFNVTTQQAAGVDYTAFKFGSLALPWRACLAGYTTPNANPQMGFDSLTIPHNPAGDPATSMRDYFDYMDYNQSTQGHLNADGLCFVQRHYPSPP